MLVEDIINDLKYGELSSHGMFMADDFTEQDKARLIHHMNIGLTALYARFPLLTRELTLIQVAGKTIYKLHSDHTTFDVNAVDYDTYLIDSIEFPFNDDLIQVLTVYDEEGNEIRINDFTADCVVTLPAPDILEIPAPVDTNALFLIYQAKPEKVDMSTKEIILPDNFKPALLAYIAHRVYSGGTAQEHVNQANVMLQKYELFCMQQREYGTDNSHENDRNIKPCLGGWI